MFSFGQPLLRLGQRYKAVKDDTKTLIHCNNDVVEDFLDFLWNEVQLFDDDAAVDHVLQNLVIHQAVRPVAPDSKKQQQQFYSQQKTAPPPMVELAVNFERLKRQRA